MSFDKITNQFNKNAIANIYPKLNLMSDTIGTKNIVDKLEKLRQNSKNEYDNLQDSIDTFKDIKKNNDNRLKQKSQYIEKLKNDIIDLKKNNNNIKKNIISKNQSVFLDNERVNRKKKIIMLLIFFSIIFLIISSKIYYDIKNSIL